MCASCSSRWVKPCFLVALMAFFALCGPRQVAMAADPCGDGLPTASSSIAEVQSFELGGKMTNSREGESRASSAKIVRRLSGATRYDTMASIVSTGFRSSSTVIVVGGENFPDALSAASLAGSLGVPVVTTGSASLAPQARQAIERLGADSVIVLGGTNAVSDSVVSSLGSMGVSVRRIWGASRQETANAVAREVAATSAPDTVVVANGYAPWDALSASSYAYLSGAPVLLADQDGTLPPSSVDVLKKMPSVKRAIILGGTAVVPDAVLSQLGGCKTERWWGQTRYETSEAIATHELSEGHRASTVVLASGENFPDALSGGSLAGSRGGVVLLTNPASQSAPAFVTSHSSEITQCFVLGGQAALPDHVESEVRLALGLFAVKAEPTVPSGEDVIVFSPHQDDELLTMGPFTEAALGNGCNVFEVLCTDGSGSFVRGELSDGRSDCDFHSGAHVYQLSKDQFATARDTEWKASCKKIGIPDANVELSAMRAVDAHMSIEEARQVILLAVRRHPDAVVCVPSPEVGPDQNVDHRTLGQAAVALWR